MECNNISAQAVEYDYFSDEHPLYQAIADSDPVRAKTTLDHMRKENIDLENLETDDYVEAPVTEALLQGLTAKTPSLEQQKVVALLLSYGASPYHNAGSVYRAPTWSRHPTLTRILIAFGANYWTNTDYPQGNITTENNCPFNDHCAQASTHQGNYRAKLHLLHLRSVFIGTKQQKRTCFLALPLADKAAVLLNLLARVKPRQAIQVIRHAQIRSLLQSDAYKMLYATCFSVNQVPSDAQKHIERSLHFIQRIQNKHSYSILKRQRHESAFEFSLLR